MTPASPATRFSTVCWPMRLLALLFSLLASVYATATHAATAPELYTRLNRYAQDYVVQQDGTFVEQTEWSMTVLKEQALAGAKRASISYSTSIQSAEIVSAYTLKPDGRRIDAPKSNYQIRTNNGRDGAGPVFSDRTSLTVVFPELAVGDTVVFAYRLSASEPLFPGQFSVTDVFSRATAMDEVNIRIDTPSSLWVQFHAHDMQEKVTQTADGRRIVEWTLSNPEPSKTERKDYSVYEDGQEPGYAFSTFRDYQAITSAYGERATPKAAVTPRIQELADRIAADRKGQKAQARALYDWVVTNITYAGNCIGLGAVVPHDVDFVLDNRMGDCKDHATLLQALFSARGIASEQALLNSGSSYALPRIPVVSTVNHVVNYLPELDIYLDATSKSTPFGMLPYADQDKPVLHVTRFRDGARTPPMIAGTNIQEAHSVITIQPDGSAQSTVKIALKGQFATESRAWMRNVSSDDEADVVKNVLNSFGYEGDGVFTKADPKPLLADYDYGAQLNFSPMLNLPGPGAFMIIPGFFSPAPVAAFIGAATQDVEPQKIACSNGRTVETYIYHFPKNVKVLSVPKNMALDSTTLTYQAVYSLEGNTLNVRRELDDRTPGNTCSAELVREQREFLKKIAPNVKAQVLYEAL